MNGTLLQGFSWYLPNDGSHWRSIADRAQNLSDLGVSAVWLPPAYKGQAGINDVGYGVYDLWDLGEFDQKGAVRTKYGTREEYLGAIQALHAHGIQVLADTVLNHKMGADASETVTATPIDQQNRTIEVGNPEQIQVWTRFTFPGRAGTYSDFEWDWTCFHGTDWDEATRRKGLWLFEGKKWNENVDDEFGNFDYLMGTDVHLTDPKVMDHLIEWGSWYLETTGVDGLRMDALKHMGRDFTMAWLDRMRDVSSKELFTVGEYWSADLGELRAFIGDDRRLSLFDVPLHFNFHHASRANGTFDMGGIFNGTLADADPTMAVTFVENHDTQDGQSLASPVDSWFKPAAYALILLREAGYPCVFHADLFGAEGEHPIAPVEGLETLMKLRKTHAYGVQWDAFDDSHVVGWARQGQADDASDGVGVVVSDSGKSAKTLNVGAQHTGQVWECVIGGCEPVQIGDDGSALFPVPDSGLSVYSPKGV